MTASAFLDMRLRASVTMYFMIATICSAPVGSTLIPHAVMSGPGPHPTLYLPSSPASLPSPAPLRPCRRLPHPTGGSAATAIAPTHLPPSPPPNSRRRPHPMSAVAAAAVSPTGLAPATLPPSAPHDRCERRCHPGPLTTGGSAATAGAPTQLAAVTLPPSAPPNSRQRSCHRRPQTAPLPLSQSAAASAAAFANVATPLATSPPPNWRQHL